jgi:membrane-bound lytic murein transglycosylase F
MNAFFKKIEANGTFANIYRKYYSNVEIFDYVDLKKYHLRLKTRLPKYKQIIQKASKENGFDWRLISAMMYQESHFDPNAKSFTGAAGIMQLTGPTAEEMEVEDRFDPKQSISGGVRYLKKLYDLYTDARNPDKMLIALASYNVGRGHILDARKLAKEKGLNPDSWAALEQTLPLLRYPKHYKKASHGYCRGTEPVRYINRILTYYDILRREAIS